LQTDAATTDLRIPSEPAGAQALRPKLATAHLSKRYQIDVIRELHLAVRPGAFYAVLGPNGCGKTTLLRILAGLEAPTSGQVLIDGEAVDLTRRNEHRVGLVFQEPRLLPWRSVEDNVRLCLRPMGVPELEARERTAYYLELVGLQGFARYYPNRLSGGMQQRASIARALAVEPDVLLMDEPFSALDAQNRRIMQDETVKLWQETRKTILFVTHSIAEAVRISGEVAVLTARPTTIRAVYTVADHADTRALEDELLRLLSEEVDRQRALDVERTRQASTA
jgi:NitT/TauT family transport system ATP-binding protein